MLKRALDWLRSFRFRHVVMVGGSVVIVLYWLIASPTGSYGVTIETIAGLATPVIALLFAHVGRKALFDYLDMGELYRKAKQTATGAGLTFLGICIVIFGLLGMFGNQVYAQSVYTYIPAGANTYVPVLIKEQKELFPEHPKTISLLV